MPQAYCILAHKNPKQVRRLVNRFRGEDHIYISVFNHNSAEKRSVWTRNFEDIISDEIVLTFSSGKNWGGFGLVQATLDGMRRFQDVDYTHFINLSGQCYPIKPIASIREHFKRSDSSFLEAKEVPWDDPSVADNGYLDRFTYRWIKVPLPATDGRVQYIKMPRLNKALPGGLIPYKGRQWFCLKKTAVEYVQREIAENPHLIRYFKTTRIPDENFFQTIIMNSTERTVLDDLRYIDWSKKGVPLPATLRMDDFDRLRTVPDLFARKFDQDSDPALLARIDKELLGQSS